ncbi:aldehyde dehydrogenase domain-containing protein [Penicillium cataractarum]|uniref:aldehyde dehydrogenase (NAD(+)) n=1 Tax=Penicillium cataractarum TaxID=2100454 RepID=A0A9W9SNV6_9EURO|nr:aldehyde dehydrogenase domain-containing protein [Penicillium cataractarum]KAJ5381149.1 aldehyde dehydrogenase domain-containing protein [Penicillium cataractarum]
MSNLFVNLTTPNGHSYTQPTGLFINNEFVNATSGQKISTLDPATEIEITTVEAAGAEDVDRAVKAAKAAFKADSWKKLPATERGRLLVRLSELLEEKKELFASIDAWDNGKTYSLAMEDDLPDSIGTFRYYGGWADKSFGQTFETSPEKFAYTLRQPYGVIGQIIPWNFPLAMAAWKLGPALAAGNTVVMKAAEQTPLSILLLATLIKEAGFPPGVVNIINGYGREAGQALTEHPLVDKLAFTGSTVTGAQVMKAAAAQLKEVVLETGGKSPLIVFGDADLDQAMKWSHAGIMSNQGQICTATSRILVQRNIYDQFLSLFKERVRTASIIGDQWSTDTFQGPQVTRAQYDRVMHYINLGKSEGATVETGGEAFAGPNGKGYFVTPTTFTNVKPSMKIYRDEIFGPVTCIVPFDEEEDAIELANDTMYGLGAAVFTQNLRRGHRVAAEIEAGTVWLNSSQDSDHRVPFGGYKASGVGRELGPAGFEAYTQIKAVHVNMGNDL